LAQQVVLLAKKFPVAIKRNPAQNIAMTLTHGFLFLGLVLSSLSAATEQQIPTGGKNLLEGSKSHGVMPKLGESTAVRTTQPELGDVWRITIPKLPPTSWGTQLGTPIKGSINEGDRCLLTFKARAVDCKKAGGTNNVEIQMPPDYTKVGQGAFSVGSEWTAVYTPFTASKSVPDSKGSVAIHLGGAAQTIEIAQIQLLNYGPDFDLAKLPRQRVTYEGREANAPWREAALARIEANRKGTLQLSIVDAAGQPIPDAEVHAELKRHAFGFGAAVTGKWLSDPSGDGEKYRAIVDENFSRVVFENDLKPFAWDIYKGDNNGTKFRKQWLDQSFSWLAEHHIPVRGHYFAWGPFEPWSEKLKSTPQAIREKVLESMRTKAPVVGDRVAEWDALNHPVGWEKGMCVDTLLGDAFYAEVFQEARKLTKLPLWINEDQVFRPGRQQDEYFTCIQKLLAAGVKIDGIGNQAHFNASFLPSPEELLANSDRFAKLVPALQLTEFDLVTDGDDDLAADFTRDLLIVCFSHPAYTGFVMWGFWEGSHWKPEAALWRKDWSEKPNAKVWKDWVCGRWKTNTKQKSSPQGQVTVPGYFGRYEITVTKNGRTTKQAVVFEKDKPTAVSIVLK
jgi:endo-1,4-beta-xylanase